MALDDKLKLRENYSFPKYFGIKQKYLRLLTQLNKYP